jgi:hypothetical protein
MSQQSGETKYYTLCKFNSKGECSDIGGRYKGDSPGQAAKKAASKVLSKGKDVKKPVKFHIRQVSHGKGHKDVFQYEATQKMVKASAFMKERTGNDKMSQKEVKSLGKVEKK